MTSPRTLLASRALHPKKQFGQNFLVDPSTARMIVDRSNLSPEDIILEIGSGLGALTIPAARQVKCVYAVEKDHEIAEVLQTELANNDINNVIIINKDILTVDINEISEKEKQKLIVLGNLPYNISSQILVALLNAKQSIDRASLMFQREVARRLAAGPGSRDYGRLSVMLQYSADVKKLATVGPHLFLPKPKVASEVVEIRFKKEIEKPVADESLLSAVVKAAFSTRRKTLKNALQNIDLNVDDKSVRKILGNSGIDPARRAESLSVAEFKDLANAFYDFVPAAERQ
ncbi:MAG: ribosomal RNA small subunit methyltransferase A [Desulfobacteraceae bacterium]|nr:ribosomal RNA small subunit methyltransferase A [Desulfobacteraceae bacterium]MBC2754650.1 ribosomal RNA small subunit methyltransferase A [Desulfobacteraceae bacterium]